MKDYKICTSCIMDTTDPDILFDRRGVCNYCQKLEPIYQSNRRMNISEIDQHLKKAAVLIKKNSNSHYDCVLGLSGGVDSSFTAYLIVEKMQLKPLIIHFDNGWNTSISEENIRKITTKLNLDVLIEKLNWEEFKDLQRAFLQASVMDIEMITDNVIFAATLKIAKAHGIKCVVSGVNFATESGMPNTWRWEKIDGKNIRSIHQIFGKGKIKAIPIYHSWQLIFDKLFKQLYFFYPLNLIQYNKTQAMSLLKNKFDWDYYGGKHYESTFTKFYQTYILPKKFGIDKRRAHLSSLLRNQEITRENALHECQSPSFDLSTIEKEIDYVRNKLGFSQPEFQSILNAEPKKHDEYPSEINFITGLTKLIRLLRLKKTAFM